MSELQDAVTLAQDAHKQRGVVVRIDAKGRCCGRKPLVYRTTQHLFCFRCCAQFSLGGMQQANWAWDAVPGGFWPKPQANREHLKEPWAKARGLSESVE